MSRRKLGNEKERRLQIYFCKKRAEIEHLTGIKGFDNKNYEHLMAAKKRIEYLIDTYLKQTGYKGEE